ncbi:MAG: hypothetical protein WA842_02560 [Croceibacterium sp.]
MKLRLLPATLVLGLLAMPAVALADDPNDPAFRNRAARAKDAAITRSLNSQALARVRQRDAAYDEAPRANAAAQADYDRRMAEWRRAVRLCESGHHEYCAR